MRTKRNLSGTPPTHSPSSGVFQRGPLHVIRRLRMTTPWRIATLSRSASQSRMAAQSRSAAQSRIAAQSRTVAPSKIVAPPALLMLLVLLGLWGSGGLPSVAEAAGNRGAFPRLDPSARVTGLAGASVALADEAYAARINPAGLLLFTGRQLSFSYADLFGLDLVQQNHVHFAWSFADKDWEKGPQGIVTRRLPPPAKFAVGVSLSQLRGETTGEDAYRETETGASLAWQGPGALVGVHVRSLKVQSGFEGLDADGLSFSIGALREVGPIRMGLHVDNLTSSLDWSIGEDEPLPRRLEFGARWKVYEGVSLVGQWSALGEDGKGDALAGAVEWQAHSSLALRGGLRNQSDAVGSSVESAAGIGFRLDQLRVDWGMAVNGRDLGTTHRWTASLDL